ncbi:hypothetical protein K505DRAFT_277146 [Melanomma pulvis-pyrius CBS 109.77]|uniref:F-box domain-containing protein n=1 Tax=Melanomma pulvis-pyrius CBS 109.77 TaxID=1314802 RepID=A0A6A6XAZ2_9PLEO|nr:hypothetical protein K505DRAFT_277146 [Melanomma pulvis-pyrius CBS 109.77]
MSQMRFNLINTSFPVELLVEVIQRIPFDSTVVLKLALVHSRFHELLVNYQTSIAKNFALRNLPHACQDFPCDENSITYAWLARCIQQYDVVDDVMAVLLSDMNCYAVEKHNMAVVNTGLLLLYRLCSIDDQNDKIAFIKSLPQDPLTAIFLSVDYATRTARYHGKGTINQNTYGRFLDANRLELRNDVEFCFSEGIMNLGPEFISDSLLNADESETTLMCLYHDHTIHDWDTANVDVGDFMPPVTQGPAQNPVTRRRSLYTTLLERLAELIDCPPSEVVSRIIHDIEVPDHSLAWLDLRGKERLVQGLDLEYVDGN